MESPEFVHVTPHISKLDLPLFAGAMRIGVWLIEADDGWTLVDTASPRDAETVYRATLDRTAGQAPQRVILTHGHYDHVGSLQTLWERWSIPMLVHRADRAVSPGILSFPNTGVCTLRLASSPRTAPKRCARCARSPTKTSTTCCPVTASQFSRPAKPKLSKPSLE